MTKAPIFTKQQIKDLLKISGPIDTARCQQYGIGSPLFVAVIEESLRMASNCHYGRDHRSGMSRLGFHRELMARRLYETYPPLEARARAACGLSFAYRYAHKKELANA